MNKIKRTPISLLEAIKDVEEAKTAEAKKAIIRDFLAQKFGAKMLAVDEETAKVLRELFENCTK